MIINRKIFVIIISISAIVLSMLLVYLLNIPLRTVNQSGEISVGYQFIQELKDDSDIIAKVSVNHVKSLEYSDVVFSVSEANISQIFKGDKADGQINILETGGVYKNSEYIFEDNKVFEKNEKAVVFLKKYEGPIVENAYVILGVFQGKFIETGDKLVPAKHTIGELKGVKTLKDLKLE